MGAFVKFDPHTFLRNREKAVLESDFVAGVAGVHVDFRKLAEEQIRHWRLIQSKV